jgi:hypothetical protein
MRTRSDDIIRDVDGRLATIATGFGMHPLYTGRVRKVAADDRVRVGDDVLLVDVSAGSVALTLPQARLVGRKRYVFYVVAQAYAFELRVVPYAGDSIDVYGAEKRVGGLMENWACYSNGSDNWQTEAGSDAMSLSGLYASQAPGTPNAVVVSDADGSIDLWLLGLERRIMAWCTPLVGSGSPEGVVTPRYPGDTYVDAAGQCFWKSWGALASEWKRLTTTSPTPDEDPGGVMPE